jgi:hypothetical protein
MESWFDDLWEAIFGRKPKARSVFSRRIQLSGAVFQWLRDPARTLPERAAFAELLLRLDADPVLHSLPILRANVPPGLRWSTFGRFKAIFQLDASQNRIRVLTCS